MSLRCVRSVLRESAARRRLHVDASFGRVMPFLTRTEADAVEARTVALEAHAGVQIVTAVVGKADQR